jgi:hypothetical protein
MRPSVIPHDEIRPGSVRKVISAPDGDLTGAGGIEAVEALIDEGTLGREFWLRIVLEPGDLEALERDGRFWLVVHGCHLQPFAFELAGA